MTAPEKLFDDVPFVDTNRMDVLLPQLYGLEFGDFMEEPALVTVAINLDEEVFTPSVTQAYATALGYAVNTQFEDDFKNWRVSERIGRPERPAFTGYLAGFPKIQATGEEAPIDCVHIWHDNSDVFLNTFAAPATAITGLSLHCRLRREFEVALQEEAHGDTRSRFKVPFLHDTEDNQTYYRPLNTEEHDEIRATIDRQMLPLQVIGPPSVSNAHYTVLETRSSDWLEVAKARIAEHY